MERQARIIDIHEYYRTGGINWNDASENLDALGIRANIGMRMDKLYLEHSEQAEKFDIDWFTWSVLDPAFPPDEQADYYTELPGVKSHRKCGDIEPVGGVMPSEYQARKFFERVDLRGGELTWFYSNHNYTQKLGFPAWINGRVIWWAEYPYEYPFIQYKYFDSYLEKNPWKIPKWAVRDGITPTFHQFTNVGDARYYLANDQTQDPQWPVGIKGADLTVSLIDVQEVKNLLDPGSGTPSLEQRVTRLENDVEILKGFHNIG